MLQDAREEPAWLWTGRVPSLDGLRAVSILIVIWHHCALNIIPQALPQALIDVGDVGVDTFFVISGFLITLLLLREQRKTGKISLRQFYLRRIFRIVPAYAAYVIIVGGALAFTASRLSLKEWAVVATYSMALTNYRPWYVGHLWSLSVEEHFYLLWPPILSLLARRRARWFALGAIAGAVVLRVGLASVFHVASGLRFFSPTRVDAIATGCLIAFLATSPRHRWIYTGAARAAVAALLALAVLALSVYLHSRPEKWAVAYATFAYRTINEIAIAVLVWLAVWRCTAWPGKLLNSRPMVVIGVLSYSLYLWQEPFLGPRRSPWIFSVPVNFLMIALMACASYCLIEQPFLRLKPRHEPTPDAARRSRQEANLLTSRA